MSASSCNDAMAGESGGNLAVSPAMSRHQLGRELRVLRETRSLRLEDVAAKLDVAPSTLSRIETGKAPTRMSYLTVMLELYGVSDEDERERLGDLARAGQCPSWTTRYRDLLLPGAGRYLDLEATCVTVCSFSAQVIPGLLHTSEYAAAAIRIGRPALTADQVRTLVWLEQQRQKTFQSGQYQVHVVLDEAVLVRPVGSPEAMAKQLDHLCTASTWPHVTIQVLPLNRSWPRLSQSFSILSLAEQGGDALAYGGISGQVIVSLRGAEVSAMQDKFAALSDSALSPVQSADLIAQRATKKRTAMSHGDGSRKPRPNTTGPMRGRRHERRHP